MNVTVVIDAFRAFATAAYILHQRPREYLLTSTSASAGRLAAADPDALLVGKPEIGARVAYDTNSLDKLFNLFTLSGQP